MRLYTAVCAFLLASVGCATVGTPPKPINYDDLRKVTDHIWTTYGRRDIPPGIRVLAGAALTCDAPSGKRGFPVILRSEDGVRPVQACREGFTFLATEVTVAWHGEPWSQTALAHEMMHIRHWREGIVDDHHDRAEWLAGGEVDQVNAQLEAMGL